MDKLWKVDKDEGKELEDCKIQWLVDFDGNMVALFGKNVRLRMDGIKGIV